MRTILPLCAAVALLTCAACEIDDSAGYVPDPPSLPVKGAVWQRNHGLYVLELDHGWIVQGYRSNGGGMAFVPKPEATHGLD
jgi:hypothetical protein